MLVWIIHHKALLLWLVLSAGGGIWLNHNLRPGGDQTVFLPGVTTDGHHQIETQCHVCHTAEKKENIFTSSGVPNSACIACHGEQLEAASDSHPARKFKNPENAVFLQHINALDCITCHREHNEKITHGMGVTIPGDYCAHCHEGIEENLPSHADLPFQSCATAGCHNYHDNVALAPSFLLKHVGEPDVLPGGKLPDTAALARWLEEGFEQQRPLVAAAADAPDAALAETKYTHDWAHSAHAQAGINCSDCHGGGSSPGSGWIDRPDHRSCSQCHSTEVGDFLAGKHGMRLVHPGLEPMSPALARREMKPGAAHRSLSCSSCHDPHRADRQFAAHAACSSCHDDAHTRSYETSKHYQLWLAEVEGRGEPGSGVSCATCHLPRERRAGDEVVVNHDQSANLRPNDKMLSSVCLNCHGMQFSMDALSDSDLVRENFSRRPSLRHPGLRWAEEAAVERGDKRVIEILKSSGASGGDAVEEHSYPPKTDN